MEVSYDDNDVNSAFNIQNIRLKLDDFVERDRLMSGSELMERLEKHIKSCAIRSLPNLMKQHIEGGLESKKKSEKTDEETMREIIFGKKEK